MLISKNSFKCETEVNTIQELLLWNVWIRYRRCQDVHLVLDLPSRLLLQLDLDRLSVLVNQVFQTFLVRLRRLCDRNLQVFQVGLCPTTTTSVYALSSITVQYSAVFLAKEDLKFHTMGIHPLCGALSQHKLNPIKIAYDRPWPDNSHHL